MAGAPRQPRGVVVRGAAPHKLPGAPDRSYYTAKHEQTVTFELEGPNVLVIDVQPHRGTEPSSGGRFAATLDGKDLAWVDVSCKPTSTRLAPDPSPRDACAAVERRFEVGKGKHRLALRLVVGESAALIPRVEAVIAKATDDLDLAPIVSNAPAATPEPSGRTEASKPAVVASAPAKNDADLDLAPIAGAATTRGSPGTSGAPAAAAPSPALGATQPATTPRVVAQQPSSPPPARANEPPTLAKPAAAPPPLVGPTASPSSQIDAAPTATGPRTQVSARSDLDLSPKAPGAQFSFGFLSKPVVWGPAALGAVGLGVAGYFGLQSRSSFSSADRPTATQIGRSDLNDKGVTQAKTANVLYGVGGVALGAAAVMAVLELVSGPSDAQGGL